MNTHTKIQTEKPQVNCGKIRAGTQTHKTYVEISGFKRNEYYIDNNFLPFGSARLDGNESKQYNYISLHTILPFSCWLFIE
jgi:hypothetical protein